MWHRVNSQKNISFLMYQSWELKLDKTRSNWKNALRIFLKLKNWQEEKDTTVYFAPVRETRLNLQKLKNFPKLSVSAWRDSTEMLTKYKQPGLIFLVKNRVEREKCMEKIFPFWSHHPPWEVSQIRPLNGILQESGNKCLVQILWWKCSECWLHDSPEIRGLHPAMHQ